MSIPFPDLYSLVAPADARVSPVSEAADWDDRGIVAPVLLMGSQQDQMTYAQFHPDADDYQAKIAHSFFDDFYHRIHIIPGSLALGNIASQQSQVIYVWNAFLTNKTITSIEAQNAEGLELQTGPVPIQFKPMQDATFTLLASVEGPPTIDAVYTFVFDLGSYDFYITGNRAIVLAFPPARDVAYEEEFYFPASVFTADAGTEQRMALTDHPLVSAEYSSYVFDEEMWLLEARLWGWQSRQYVVPNWKSATQLSSPASPGALSLSVKDTAHREFQVGELAVLFSSPEVTETVEVSEVGVGYINILRPLNSYWPPGAPVMPVRQMRLSRRVAYSGAVANEKQFNFALSCDMAEPQAQYVWPWTYAGLPVLEFSPDMKAGVEGDFSRAYESLGTPYGQPYIHDKTGVSTHRSTWTLTFETRLEAYRFLSLLCQLNGVRGEFWAATWGPDLKVVDTVAAASALLKVKSVGMASMYQDLRGKHGLRIELKNGQVLYRQIQSITTSSTPGVEEVTVTAPFASQILAAEIKYVSFLVRSRFDQDKFKFRWSTLEWSEVQVSIKGLSDAI